MKWWEKTNWGQRVVTERIKFRIANLLDRRSSLCWAELAMWAMNLSPWWTILGVLLPGKEFGGQSFRQNCRFNNLQQYPFCGKCWRRDRWLEGCSPQQIEEANAMYPVSNYPSRCR